MFIRGRRLLIFWLSGAAFIWGRRLFEGGVYSRKYGMVVLNGSSAWESRDWDFKVSKMADFFKRVISSRSSNTDWKHPLKTSFELLQFFAESTSYKLHKTLRDGEFFFVDKPVRAAKSASAGEREIKLNWVLEKDDAYKQIYANEHELLFCNSLPWVPGLSGGDFPAWTVCKEKLALTV